MKRLIIIGILIMLCSLLFAGRSATPHPVYIELHDSLGNVPSADSLEINCWLSSKPDEIMNLEDPNVLFPIKDVFLQIQCSGFSSWTAGDILFVDIKDNKTEESINLELELTFDNFQLFTDKHLTKNIKEKQH